MRIEYISSSPDDTISFGTEIGKSLKGGEIFALQGTLAAGKTTITKGIALGLDIPDNITSPTFCLVSEYSGRLPLFHMDVYRLDSSEDFINLGVDDMLYGNGVCLIEWSEKIMDELPESAIILRLEPLSDSSKRKITIENWPYGEIK